MSVFSKAEKVWLPEGERGILQIKIPFRARDALLKIACESDYAVYLDGAFLYAAIIKLRTERWLSTFCPWAVRRGRALPAHSRRAFRQGLFDLQARQAGVDLRAFGRGGGDCIFPGRAARGNLPLGVDRGLFCHGTAGTGILL